MTFARVRTSPLQCLSRVLPRDQVIRLPAHLGGDPPSERLDECLRTNARDVVEVFL